MSNKINSTQELPKVWWVQCKPFDPKKRVRGDQDLENFQRDCLKKCYFGMGWNLPMIKEIIENHTGQPISDEIRYKLKACLKEGNEKTKGFSTAQNQYAVMKKSDVALTKLNDIYYAGVINKGPRVSCHPNLTWEAHVEKWIKLGTGKDLPAHVWGTINSKKNNSSTIAEIKGLSALTILNLTGVKTPVQIINQDNFFMALGPGDLEDLMAHYMQEKNENFVFLPSSCKTNTPGIEYVMYDPKTDELIACQTKVNKEINASEYLKESYKKYSRIYLFSGKECVNTEQSCNGKICVVKKEELYNLLKTNCHFSNIVKEFFALA